MKTVLTKLYGISQAPKALRLPVAHGRKHGVLRRGWWLLASAIVVGAATPSPAAAVPGSPAKSLWYEAPATRYRVGEATFTREVPGSAWLSQHL